MRYVCTLRCVARHRAALRSTQHYRQHYRVAPAYQPRHHVSLDHVPRTASEASRTIATNLLSNSLCCRTPFFLTTTTCAPSTAYPTASWSREDKNPKTPPGLVDFVDSIIPRDAVVLLSTLDNKNNPLTDCSEHLSGEHYSTSQGSKVDVSAVLRADEPAVLRCTVTVSQDSSKFNHQNLLGRIGSYRGPVFHLFDSNLDSVSG
eukprot:1177189-Prorocentrum_minimum.AAC.3